MRGKDLLTFRFGSQRAARGNASLEQVLLVCAVLMVAATGLQQFFNNMASYFDQFNDSQQ